jgi:probable HAF family extracellular repeat protein
VEELPLTSSDRNGIAQAINDAGHIVGGSGDCIAFAPGPGNSLQPLHAFLWEAGRVVDLGNLGGRGLLSGHFAHMINNNDEVVGSSDLAGDKSTHAFRWTKIAGMQDLGTLDGDVLSIGLGLNDSGVATGISANADFSMFRAFLWRGGVMMDLNKLIPATSSLYLLTACSINARGEIIGFAVDAAGDLHAYLAAPLTAGEDQFETGARPVSLPAATRLRISRLMGIHAKREAK